MRFFLVILFVASHSVFLHATEQSFKFTFGSNLGKIPFEINKTDKNIKTIGGVQINSWTLSPFLSSFNSKTETRNFTKTKENLYIKIKFKF